MDYKTHYGTYRVLPIRREYNNKTLAIQLQSYDGEPISTLTVNLPDEFIMISGENYAFVDTNNNPNAEEFIQENELGIPTGYFGRSGFCEYPLYIFDLSKLIEGRQ